MNLKFAYSAFGWLALSGVLHFIADVVYQHVSGKRMPGDETTYYYGLHSAYALGQVLFGLTVLLVVRHAPRLFAQWPMRALCLLSLLGWAAICFFFIEYWQPKLNLGIHGVLLVLGFIIPRKEEGLQPAQI